MLKKILVSLVVAFVVIGVCTITCHAQESFDGLFDLQRTSIEKTGINGTYPFDVNGLYNMATIFDTEATGYKNFASISAGQTNLSTGVINYNYLGGLGKLSPRFYASVYKYRTKGNLTFDTTVPLAGTSTSINVDGTELCFAYKLSDHLRVGCAIQSESGNTNLSMSGIPLANMDSTSNNNYRFGAQYLFNPQWKIGTVFTTRNDEINLYLAPSMTGTPTNIDVKGVYKTRTWTHGITYSPTPATSIFYNQHYAEYRSPSGISQNENFSYYGVSQYFSPQWNLKLAQCDEHPEISLTYMNSKSGWLGSIDWKKGRTLPGFGKNTTVFITVGKYFGSDPQPDEPAKPQTKKIQPPEGIMDK